MEQQQSRKKKTDEMSDDPFATLGQVKANRFERRRAKIVSEIQRNKRGDYTVPTWVLTALLVLIIASFAAIILFAS